VIRYFLLADATLRASIQAALVRPETTSEPGCALRSDRAAHVPGANGNRNPIAKSTKGAQASEMPTTLACLCQPKVAPG